jgi:hypothetical protein
MPVSIPSYVLAKLTELGAVITGFHSTIVCGSGDTILI